jgi:hypothetical protein
MCSCMEAFSEVRSCAILVIGVSGSLPVHGIGTANFVVKDNDGFEQIWSIHNCLLCHRENGEESFNLISVSQMLRTKQIKVSFGADLSEVMISTKKKKEICFPLVPDDGLYSLNFGPISWNDSRFESLTRLEVTLEDDPVMRGVTSSAMASKVNWSNPVGVCGPPVAPSKSPNKLGAWHAKIFWIGKCLALPGVCKGFDTELDEFCSQYIAPLSTPSSKRTYQVDNIDDMADLSIRFFGIGTERLEKTLERSIGLTPKVKIGKKMRNKVPAHNFPQGRWKTGKTPRVSKGIVHNLHKASIAEALFMDTFEVDDSTYRYGQAFVDYRSKFGEIVPMKSRTQVGWSFTVFCACHFTPLILIRDNIGENVGGSLIEECLKRSVRSAFICPYKKQQNYAEGYLGRITALASYGMVFAGAPLFMWRWCVACAVFINNITATYYSEENTWATPYEVVHNEPFPDASIVVPFGCGVLVLLTDDERGKFKSRCALMIFAHYANQHPLYTYAVYSPRTKRILYRQDCIFLTNLFPMRTARAQNGLPLNGESIIAYRSPETIREGERDEFSFCGWTIEDPLPEFQDHVSGHKLTRPAIEKTMKSNVEGTSFSHPNNPMFGPESVVKVHTPSKFKFQLVKDREMDGDQNSKANEEQDHEENENQDRDQSLGTNRLSRVKSKEGIKQREIQKRTPVNQRWYYETVPQMAMDTTVTDKKEGDEICLVDDKDVADDSTYDKLLEKAILTANDKYEFAVLMEELFIAPPDGLGEVVPLEKEIFQEITDDEVGASQLQGLLFYDEGLQWCRVNGWGVDHGIPLIYYSSVSSDDPVDDEHHMSVKEMLALLSESAIVPVYPKYEPSRTLQRPKQDLRLLVCYRQVNYKPSCDVPTVGKSTLRQFGAKLGSYDRKVMSDRTIRRILRAQETMFKYGTLIPRNDAEANASPEAKR